MVVFYEKNNDVIRKVVMVEHEVMSPTVPADKDLNEKILYYEERNMSFISLPYELGGEIFDYDLCFNDKGIFMALIPMVVEEIEKIE